MWKVPINVGRHIRKTSNAHPQMKAEIVAQSYNEKCYLGRRVWERNTFTLTENMNG